jgi:hypothetical protein
MGSRMVLVRPLCTGSSGAPSAAAGAMYVVRLCLRALCLAALGINGKVESNGGGVRPGFEAKLVALTCFAPPFGWWSRGGNWERREEERKGRGRTEEEALVS